MTAQAPASVVLRGRTDAWIRSENDPDLSAQVDVSTRWKVKAAAGSPPVTRSPSSAVAPDVQTPPPDAVKVPDPSNELSATIDTGSQFWPRRAELQSRSRPERRGFRGEAPSHVDPFVQRNHSGSGSWSPNDLRRRSTTALRRARLSPVEARVQQPGPLLTRAEKLGGHDEDHNGRARLAASRNGSDCMSSTWRSMSWSSHWHTTRSRPGGGSGQSQ